MIGFTNAKASASQVSEYVRPVGVPDMDTIAANAPIIEQGGVNYYPIFAAAAMDTFISKPFTKTETGLSTGADAYVFSDEPTTLYVGDTTHTFNTANDYSTDQSWKARYYIGYATETNKNASAGITINLYSYKATYEFVGTQYLKLSATSALFGATSGSSLSIRYINLINSSFYNNTIAANYFCNRNYALETFILPSTVISITGQSILLGCFILEKLDLKNITTISGYEDLRALSGLKELIANNLTTISGTGGSGVFSSCAALKTINLPALTTISGASVFVQCQAIETINLPALTTISGASVFGTCDNIKSVNLPALTTFNASAAFRNSYSLKYFKIPNTISTITNSTATTLDYCSFLELPDDFNITGCNFTGATGYPKSQAWFVHLATQLADRTATTTGTMVLGAANIALIPVDIAAIISGKNWTIS